MIAYRVTLSNDNTPEKPLGYRSQLKTAQIVAKEYMKEAGAVNEAWKPEENCVQFFIGEIIWKIHFEEINIEY